MPISAEAVTAITAMESEMPGAEDDAAPDVPAEIVGAEQCSQDGPAKRLRMSIWSSGWVATSGAKIASRTIVSTSAAPISGETFRNAFGSRRRVVARAVSVIRYPSPIRGSTAA